MNAHRKYDAHEFLRRLNAGLERQARAIGQSLHDEAGQLLTAAYIALSEAARDLPPRSRGRLTVVRQHLAAVEEHLRHVAHELRPRVLDDLGLVPALEFLAHGFELRQGTPTTVRAALDAPLPHIVETVVYRIVQEALTNIGRHAHARRAAIRLTVASGKLRCSIRDDGAGFNSVPPPAGGRSDGLGLRGIRERLDFVGGELRVRSTAGAGTELVVTIPLPGHAVRTRRSAAPHSAAARRSPAP